MKKKKKLSRNDNAPKAPKSSVSKAEYAALPTEQKALYRPVDPKYERLPPICWALYGLAALSLVLYIIMSYSVAFADWFNETVGAFVRGLLAGLTNWIPFSVGEMTLWMLPLILFLVFKCFGARIALSILIII